MTRQTVGRTAESPRVPRLNARPLARPQAKAQPPNGFARLTARERHQMIRALAHQMARERGFAPGRELDDWLAAEKTIDALFI